MDIPFTFALDEATQIAMLAASAPKEIPMWFKPRLPEDACPEFISADQFADRFDLNARSIVDDDDGILTSQDHVILKHAEGRSMASQDTLIKAAAAFRKLQKERQKARYEWIQNQQMERLLQWPIHYAREVLARKLMF